MKKILNGKDIKRLTIFGLVAAVLAAVCLSLGFVSSTTPTAPSTTAAAAHAQATPQSTPQPAKPEMVSSIGQQAQIGGNTSSTFAATSSDALSSLLKTINANDTYGELDLLASGQVVNIPVHTKVLVIGKGFLTTNVRVLEGQYAGASVWLPQEFVVSL
jgi:hypothetical protein